MRFESCLPAESFLHVQPSRIFPRADSWGSLGRSPGGSYTPGHRPCLDHTDQIWCQPPPAHRLRPPQPLLTWGSFWIALRCILAWESQPVRTVSSSLGGVARTLTFLPVRHGRNHWNRYDHYFISIQPPKECIGSALALHLVIHTWHLPSLGTFS